MGALPSRETHQRGLYSHRHGRNRRSEIILIPLTSTFFPSPDCALFQHLYNARNRRTVKYYLRAPRPAETSMESDYFCNTMRVNEPETFDKFVQERLEAEKKQQRQHSQSSQTQPMGSNFKSYPSNPLFAATKGSESHFDSCMLGGEPTKKSTAGDYDYQSYTDTPEGLYDVLVRETDLCVFDTDQELRDAYRKQVQRQRMELDKTQSWRHRKTSVNAPSSTASEPFNISSTNTAEYHLPQSQSPHSFMKGKAHSKDIDSPDSSIQMQKGNCSSEPSVSLPPFVPDVSLSPMENISFDAFISGYAAAKKYMKGRQKHTLCRAVDNNFCGGSDTLGVNSTQSPNYISHGIPRKPFLPAEHSGARKYVKHVTSPSAYYIHPIPCVIALRYVDKRPPAPDDPYCVMFDGFCVKIMGMFGLFPTTVPMRYKKVSSGSREAAMDDFPTGGSPAQQPRQSFHPARTQKEDPLNSDDDLGLDRDEEVTIEQHFLKGSMFVDKDVGDQILGNMVMLATYMYVRQSIEARIQPQYIPMLPFFMRFPLSNIPMLQFVREFRLRLRTLLEAGTAKSGSKPTHAGLSGVNAEEGIEDHDPEQLRSEAEGYLFEEDIPDPASPRELFMSAHLQREYMAAMKRPTSNTNPGGSFPIMILSGFNVQHTPLRHPGLNATRRSGGAAAGPFRPPGGAGRKPSRPCGAPPGFGFPAPPSGTDPEAEAARLARLLHRKRRFRVWVEDGHVCVWASAAYARRACVLLAQQLNTTVDGTALPGMRAWRYRGLLHGGAVVPRPEMANDVLIVAEDVPSAGLWQGDVLRCCTHDEMLARQGRQPLPLPGSSVVAGGLAEPRTLLEKGALDSPYGNRSAAVYLPEQTQAPPGAFWVRGSGGLDDSYTDITESNFLVNPKMDKQLQQVAQQQVKKRAASVAARMANLHCGVSGMEDFAATSMAAFNAQDDAITIDYREGTLKIEEVILSWMRSVYIQIRKIPEDEGGWLCDPSGCLVRLDRYTFHHFEHDGVRFFIGSTTRFVGQQQRIEKMLDQLDAMEKQNERISSTKSDKAVSGNSTEGLLGLRSTDSALSKNHRFYDPGGVSKPFGKWKEAVGDSEAFSEIVDDVDEDMDHLIHIDYGNYLASDD